MQKETCPKCNSSNAYYDIEEDAIVLKCLCGLHKYLKQVVNGMTIETRLDKGSIRLPKKGSKLGITLDIIVGSYPDPVTTETIVANTKENMNDTGSRLSVLFSRQIIDRCEYGKGLPGGSSWVLSESGAKMIIGEDHAVQYKRR